MYAEVTQENWISHGMKQKREEAEKKDIPQEVGECRGQKLPLKLKKKKKRKKERKKILAKK